MFNPKRDMQEYTHLAKLYGFKCYFNSDTNEVKGTNLFNNLLIQLFVWIDITFTDNEAFKIEILEEL
jgi:hypothetical protein